MQVKLDFNSAADYRLFLRIKSLPRFKFTGRVAEVPDEYSHLLGMPALALPTTGYTPSPFLFDYQASLAGLSIRKQKFACFAEPGLGKTLILWEYARHVASVLPEGQCILIVSPLMVIRQTLSEAERFYAGAVNAEQVRAKDLPNWLRHGGRIGITNYEAIKDGLPHNRLGCLILDESSLLKSSYGRWGKRLIELGKGLQWKLCLTGTPAPNDRIEYSNHAVFLDQFPTANSFLARYFVNKGKTNNRWELKPHALRPFYRALSDWCVFLTNPGVYGWKDNADGMPPINVQIHDVPLTEEQRRLVAKVGGDMYGTPGGITSRSKLGQLAKGHYAGKDVPTNKPAFIRDLVASWPDESTIIWCIYNREHETMERIFPDAASIWGKTPYEKRTQLIEDFQAGRRKILISKSKVIGLGLNLQVATRQVFSGLADSYEAYWQSVKRSNRVGSIRPLNVHLPVTEIERPMIETVLRKAKRVQQDAEEQEAIFKENRVVTA